MKVLFVNRKDCFTLRGGDTVQMEKTKEYLEKQFTEIKIIIATTSEEILKNNDADIIHIFNMINTLETLEFINTAKKTNKKIVLSTIFMKSIHDTCNNYLSRISINAFQAPEFIKQLIVKTFNLLNYVVPYLNKKNKHSIDNGLYTSSKHKKLGLKILNNVDLILPNSDKELRDINEYYKSNFDKKALIIPNATEYIHVDENIDFKNKYNLPDKFILQVGRIEPLKNQLNLIKALYKNDIPIVFIGKLHIANYSQKVKALARQRGNVFFIEEISHSEVMQMYKLASVHVLPSVFETTGLVSIEARACGCEIVVSNEKHCPIKYYHFDKIAHICDPFSLESIRNAILEALKTKKQPIDDEYKQFFSYENVAKLTYKAYKKVLQ